mmetsp:Transcript_23367/g.32647  ORF Transcript_23367/g.32647 Transcript_23367/m.32647 type:complete len:96 (-) Transcript_23367:20-307(-)
MTTMFQKMMKEKLDEVHYFHDKRSSMRVFLCDCTSGVSSAVVTKWRKPSVLVLSAYSCVIKCNAICVISASAERLPCVVPAMDHPSSFVYARGCV